MKTLDRYHLLCLVSKPTKNKNLNGLLICTPLSRISLRYVCVCVCVRRRLRFSIPKASSVRSLSYPHIHTNTHEPTGHKLSARIAELVQCDDAYCTDIANEGIMSMSHSGSCTTHTKTAAFLET